MSNPFFFKNKNILPHWFIQAIQPVPLKTSLGQGAIDTIKVTTPSQDHHNQITINHHSPTNETSYYIPSDQSGTLTSLDSYNNKDESIKSERLFVSPYCHKFGSTSEREYQRHIVLKYLRKSGYPNTSPGIE